MPFRRLVSLYGEYGEWVPDRKWHVTFGYYYKANRKFTGKSEEADLTESELYELLRPSLKTHKKKGAS